MNAIQPFHQSKRKFLPPVRDKSFGRVYADPQVIAGVEKIAIDIFTDLINAGQPLQVVLAAIYVSGLQHAAEAAKEKGNWL